MNAGNETCCLDHEGVKEITYHNTATIPTVAEAWSTYYEDAGYSIPSTTSQISTSISIASKGAPTSFIPSTTGQTSTSLSIASKGAPTSFIPSTTGQTSTSLSIASKGALTSSTPITSEKTSASAPATSISSSAKAFIGTAAGLVFFGAVGSLYLFRRSRAKRLEQARAQSAPKVANFDVAELAESSVQTETNSTRVWPVNGTYLDGRNMLTGQGEGIERAEMSG